MRPAGSRYHTGQRSLALRVLMIGGGMGVHRRSTGWKPIPQRSFGVGDRPVYGALRGQRSLALRVLMVGRSIGSSRRSTGWKPIPRDAAANSRRLCHRAMKPIWDRSWWSRRAARPPRGFGRGRSLGFRCRRRWGRMCGRRALSRMRPPNRSCGAHRAANGSQPRAAAGGIAARAAGGWRFRRRCACAAPAAGSATGCGFPSWRSSGPAPAAGRR